MAEEFEITEEMRKQIGKESPPWTYELTTTSVRAFARGVGYTDPVYFDVEAARAAGYRNLPASSYVSYFGATFSELVDPPDGSPLYARIAHDYQLGKAGTVGQYLRRADSSFIRSISNRTFSDSSIFTVVPR